MTDSRPYAVRQAFEAARTALGAMMAADEPTGTSAVSHSGGSTNSGESDSRPKAERAQHAWHAAERVLQALTGRKDFGGQSVIAEARRQQLLALSDAHALAALHSWADRASTSTTGLFDTRTDAERVTASDAMQALEHAVQSIESRNQPSAETAVADSALEPDVSTASPVRRQTNRRMLWSFVALLVVAGIAVGAWFVFAGRGTEAMYRDAVAAYQRGARDIARIAFARVAQERPDDPRPLVFLGRISREEGDMPRAKRFLEAAIQRAPENSLAQREMASALFAEGQPELARRFYVRALEIEPTDRVAQGFLGCALFRLGRIDEARRWFDRAGPGEWASCAGAIPAPYPGTYAPPSGGMQPTYPPQQPPVAYPR